MLKISVLPILLKIVSKLDIKPAVALLKGLDIFDDVQGKGAEGVKKALTREKMGQVAFEIIAELTPQLGKIADDIPPLVAVYKGVSVEEAMDLDVAEIINELINDEGIITFFKRALQKKVEQEA